MSECSFERAAILARMRRVNPFGQSLGQYCCAECVSGVSDRRVNGVEQIGRVQRRFCGVPTWRFVHMIQKIQVLHFMPQRTRSMRANLSFDGMERGVRVSGAALHVVRTSGKPTTCG